MVPARTCPGRRRPPGIVGASLHGGTSHRKETINVLVLRSSGRHEGRLPRSREGKGRSLWLGCTARRAGSDPPAVVLYGRPDHVRRARTRGYRPVDAPGLGPAPQGGEAPAGRLRSRSAVQAHRRTADPDRGGRRADRAPEHGRRTVRATGSCAPGSARGRPRSLAVGTGVPRSPGWSAHARNRGGARGGTA